MRYWPLSTLLAAVVVVGAAARRTLATLEDRGAMVMEPLVADPAAARTTQAMTMVIQRVPLGAALVSRIQTAISLLSCHQRVMARPLG